MKTDINISVKNIEEKIVDATSTPSMRLLLEWEAATMPGLFPLMKGELSVYPLTSTETQLDFSGVYEPPFGAVGKTVNAIVAPHRRGARLTVEKSPLHSKPSISENLCTH